MGGFDMMKNYFNMVMGSVKWVLPFYFLTFLPLSMMAQDDDLYFGSKKKKTVEQTTDRYGMPKDTYYPGSSRSVDEYNRRYALTDSTRSDIIDFTGEKGVYPDSVDEDFKITKEMSRFDDYRLADNAAFWAGYEAGLHNWGWFSPWYYNRYGWYSGWYDPWYSWRYGYYGWYDPWYYGYAGWYDPWYYGYGYYGWGYPYYYHRPVIAVVGGNPRYSHIGSGTIRRDGTTGHYGGYRGAVAGNSNRVSSLRHRAESLGGSRRSSGNTVRSGGGNFSGYRGNTSSSSSRSNGSFSGSRSSGGFSSGGSRSSGGGFSGGGSRGGGGGGGGRLGGRR